MSYHILHQFDEQWFADSTHHDRLPSNGFFQGRADRRDGRQKSNSKSYQRPWVIVTASLIIAACALYFAMDARRQTVALQQRLSDVESRLAK
jgi:hypothetical protein